VIKRPAAKLAAIVLVVGGLALAPLLDDDGAAEEPHSSAIVVPPARFEIRRRDGELTLTGHTASATHEQDLLQVAASSYPDVVVSDRFEPLGIVPEHWTDTTVQLVYLLAESASADATLSQNNVVIRSVTVDELGWRNRLQAMKKVLPSDVSVLAKSLTVEASPNIRTICARAFESFESGPINFEESSASFRSSAYPRLDRIVALARTCNESKIAITGHTDASGDDTWNRRLSLKRAQVVAEYLVAGGVVQTRLAVVGAGSTAPIADNQTRYGRSLNRRIDIVLSSPTR